MDQSRRRIHQRGQAHTPMHQLGSIGFNELMMPHAPWNTTVAASPAATARARGAKALHMIHLSELPRIGGCDARLVLPPAPGLMNFLCSVLILF
jgi:hypothetical protein